MVRLRLSAESEAPPQPFGPEFDRAFGARMAEADAFYESRLPAEMKPEERRIARQAYAGLLWTKQFYHFSVKDWLEGDPVAAASAAGPQGRPQLGLGAPLQPRRHLDAGQVGVPLVRRVGPGVPHGPVRADRSRLRQAAADPPPARVVHASQRADPRLRVGLRRREPPGPRLGRLARLQDHGRAGQARPRFPRARLPEAPHQLHVVGQPQGPRGEEPVRRRIPRARQHRRLRPIGGAADGRAPRAGRRDRVDGVLLRDDAVDGARARRARTPPTRTSPRSSSSTSSRSWTR